MLQKEVGALKETISATKAEVSFLCDTSWQFAESLFQLTNVRHQREEAVLEFTQACSDKERLEATNDELRNRIGDLQQRIDDTDATTAGHASREEETALRAALEESEAVVREDAV